MLIREQFLEASKNHEKIQMELKRQNIELQSSTFFSLTLAGELSTVEVEEFVPNGAKALFN